MKIPGVGIIGVAIMTLPVLFRDIAPVKCSCIASKNTCDISNQEHPQYGERSKLLKKNTSN
jgi:hypothetical protein